MVNMSCYIVVANRDLWKVDNGVAKPNGGLRMEDMLDTTKEKKEHKSNKVSLRPST